MVKIHCLTHIVLSDETKNTDHLQLHPTKTIIIHDTLYIILLIEVGDFPVTYMNIITQQWYDITLELFSVALSALSYYIDLIDYRTELVH